MEIGDYISFSPTTWLTAAAAAILIWLSIRKPGGLPPGPWIIFPLVGHLPLLRGDTREVLLKMGRKYGDIFHLYMGKNLVIVLNRYDVIREALVSNGDVFSNRPQSAVYELYANYSGIVFSSGRVWEEQRRFVMDALRDRGLGKTELQGKIMEEVTAYLEAIGRKREEAFDTKKLTQTAMCNVISNMAFSKRFDYKDPLILRGVEMLEKIEEATNVAGLLNFIPWLKYLPGNLFNTKILAKVRESVEELIIKPGISEHLTKSGARGDDLIDRYFKEIAKRQGTSTSFNEQQLRAVIYDLYVGGTLTSATLIQWSLVYFMNYPNVQEKFYKEIQNKIGYRMPRIEDRNDLPYVQAFILEVLRHSSIAPVAVAHATSQEVTFRGYRIEKGTMIIPFIHSVLRDPTIWKNPEMFNPERFLRYGKFTNPDQLIPFSLGRRVCLGESLARMELFLFLVSMVQRFQFIPAEDLPPSVSDFVVGQVYAPKPFQLRAIRRQ